jgi:hypothetical protein
MEAEAMTEVEQTHTAEGDLALIVPHKRGDIRPANLVLIALLLLTSCS